MPEQNRFRHQSYPTRPAVAPTFHKLTVTDGEGVDFTRLHTELGVRQVVVVHGTFMGNDPLAVSDILLALTHDSPGARQLVTPLADGLRNAMEKVANGIARDIANYPTEFREIFQQLVGTDPHVTLPVWSGQNHHRARADLAVQLLCRLDDFQPTATERVLFWGHSHAGNSFAILSNLLANDRASVDRFFEAAEAPVKEHWDRARQILAAAPSPHPWAQSVLIAAFGTPVRYGWDTTGYRHLVHVLHHRNYDAENPIVTRPMFPPHSLPATLSARYGDWVQAFAIAGTDIALSGTRQRAHEILTALLEDGLAEPEHGLDTEFIRPLRVRDACARWKTGTRCHADGQNLLVDYEPSGRRTRLGLPVEESVLGHGVATTENWLPAHLALLMESFRSASL